MRNFLKSAALIGLALGALVAEAKADVVFTFVEVSATVDGIPTNAGASGEVVLTDAGFASGSVSVSTILATIPLTRFLDGVVSMFFQSFTGPRLGTETGDFGFDAVNFTATVNGPFLNLSGPPGGGIFLSDGGETEEYLTGEGGGPVLPFSHLQTIQYASDNNGAACSPNGSDTRLCYVSGFFVNLNAIPEPGSLSVLIMAVSAFAVLGIAGTRKKGGNRNWGLNYLFDVVECAQRAISGVPRR